MNGAGGNLKSLYHRELRSYPQVSKYILVDIIFDFEGLDMFGPFYLDLYLEACLPLRSVSG